VRSCVCVCMFICMYPCVCLFECVYVCMHVCPYVWMYEGMYVCMYICMYVCMYARTYVCTNSRMCVCVHIRMYAYIYGSKFMYVCIYLSYWYFKERDNAMTEAAKILIAQDCTLIYIYIYIIWRVTISWHRQQFRTPKTLYLLIVIKQNQRLQLFLIFSTRREFRNTKDSARDSLFLFFKMGKNYDRYRNGYQRLIFFLVGFYDFRKGTMSWQRQQRCWAQKTMSVHAFLPIRHVTRMHTHTIPRQNLCRHARAYR